MQLAHVEELDVYLRMLQKRPEELNALADGFLINVTSFFRDREVFQQLEREIIPELFRGKRGGDNVRVWSVGCATGEEAYSVAMLLLEQASQHSPPPVIQVFASDLHDQSLKRARAGGYPGDIEVDVYAERLSRFFHSDNGAYRIRKEVRDLVVFAPHNLLVDPPFSRIDLILCRNALIYLQRNLQPDVIELFHYSLNPSGWLILGTAESVDNSDLFATESKPNGIYRKHNRPRPEPRLPPFPFSRNRSSKAPEQLEEAGELLSFGAIHHRMVERYAPPSILVGSDNKPDAIQAVSSRLLAEYLQVDRVAIEPLSSKHNDSRPSSQEWAGSAQDPARFWQGIPKWQEHLNAGRCLVADDISELPELTAAQAADYRSRGMAAHVIVPLLQDGQLIAVLAAHHSSRRECKDSEVSLIAEVAEKTWASAERARAEQAIRQREAALQEADRCKDEFLAVLSHELRNPLTPIVNSLQILDHASPGEAQALAAKQVIKRQVALLARLVDDLLDLTRVSRGKVQLVGKRLLLNELVERTVEDHLALFGIVGVLLEVDTPAVPVWVHGDANRLVQTVGNLLQNAATFTPAGGATRVSLGIDDDNFQAVLRVSDSGEGMTDEVINKLFQPFMQAEATLDRSRGGLGLGLALTKRLVELHGGRISASSDGPGKGSEFTVCLPLDRSEPSPVAAEPASSPAASCRILIIEDNVDAADTLRQVLELNDHQVAMARTGLDGLAKAREFQPQMILCDIGLPGMSGYEVATALKADELLEQPMVVALSGYAMPEDRLRAAAAGFDHHLAKPPSLEELYRLIDEAQKRSQKP